MKKSILFFTTLLISCVILAGNKKNKQQKTTSTMVIMETSLGNMTIKLYDETPKHKENFLNLIKKNYYDSLLFHRVIKDFMIQAGDPNSKNAEKGKLLGNGGPEYQIEAEFNKKLIHKKGALAAARMGDEVNPQKKSSGSQFYIVQGKKYSAEELKQIEQLINQTQFESQIMTFLYAPENKPQLDKLIEYYNAGNNEKAEELMKEIEAKIKEQNPNTEPFVYTEEAKLIYQNIGGTPFLDMNYTVFGEVVEGLDVIDKIAQVECDNNNRPKVDVMIKSIKIINK